MNTPPCVTRLAYCLLFFRYRFRFLSQIRRSQLLDAAREVEANWKLLAEQPWATRRRIEDEVIFRSIPKGGGWNFTDEETSRPELRHEHIDGKFSLLPTPGKDGSYIEVTPWGTAPEDVESNRVVLESHLAEARTTVAPLWAAAVKYLKAAAFDLGDKSFAKLKPFIVSFMTEELTQSQAEDLIRLYEGVARRFIGRLCPPLMSAVNSQEFANLPVSRTHDS